MCGIFLASLKEFDVSLESRAQKSLSELSHRGPDENSLLILDEGKVIIGHTRLSIVGIDNGSQPITNNGITVVVNGEFYGFKEIKKELSRSLGYVFKTESDSEIIIPLYLEYGVKLFEYLNGEFSFIIFDSTNNLVIAARDRFGVKPLSYCIDAGNIIISSEIKAIKSFDSRLVHSFNINSLSSFYHCVPNQEETVFSGILNVKPAHYIKYHNGELSSHNYWDLPIKEDISNVPVDELISNFRKALDLSVSKRLVADVPVGCYLSGGIDSTSILSIARKVNSNIRAFNIEFDDPEYNESPLAKKSAKYLSVDLDTVFVNETMLSDNFEKAVIYREAPIYQLCGIAKFLLSKYVNSKGIKTVITGEGADEMLGGYQYFREDNFSVRERDDLIQNMRLQNIKTSSAYVSNGEYHELNGVREILGYIPSQFKLGFDIFETIKPILVKQSLYKPPYLDLIDGLQLGFKEPVNTSTYIWAKTFFPENILSFLGDRVEMANSIEGRLPFLDLDLVNFSLALPINMKINGSIEKYILKEAMKGDIPEEIYQRQKHIFAAPPITISRNPSPLATHFMDVINSTDFLKLDIFNKNTKKILSSFLSTKDRRQKMINEFVVCLILSIYYLNKFNRV